jgi:hypothetical protein
VVEREREGGVPLELALESSARIFSGQHILCTWHVDAYDAHIKSYSSISNSTLLGRLRDRGLFVKNTIHSGGGVFPKIYE